MGGERMGGEESSGDTSCTGVMGFKSKTAGKES